MPSDDEMISFASPNGAFEEEAEDEQPIVSAPSTESSIRRMLGVGPKTKIVQVGAGLSSATLSLGPKGLTLSPLQRCGDSRMSGCGSRGRSCGRDGRGSSGGR